MLHGLRREPQAEMHHRFLSLLFSFRFLHDFMSKSRNIYCYCSSSLPLSPFFLFFSGLRCEWVPLQIDSTYRFKILPVELQLWTQRDLSLFLRFFILPALLHFSSLVPHPFSEPSLYSCSASKSFNSKEAERVVEAKKKMAIENEFLPSLNSWPLLFVVVLFGYYWVKINCINPRLAELQEPTKKVNGHANVELKRPASPVPVAWEQGIPKKRSKWQTLLFAARPFHRFSDADAWYLVFRPASFALSPSPAVL